MLITFTFLFLSTTLHAAPAVQQSPVPRQGFSIIPTPASRVPMPGLNRAAPPAATAQDPVSELANARAQLNSVYNSFNAVNPFSADGSLDPNKVPSTSDLMPTEAIQKFQKVLAHPAVQGYLRFFSNPLIADGVTGIAQHPRKKTLLIVEILLFVLMIIFRSWRNSLTYHWAQRLWIRFYSLGIHLVLGVIVVPLLILGTSYQQFLFGIWQVLKK